MNRRSFLGSLAAFFVARKIPASASTAIVPEMVLEGKFGYFNPDGGVYPAQGVGSWPGPPIQGGKFRPFDPWEPTAPFGLVPGHVYHFSDGSTVVGAARTHAPE